MEAAQDLYSVLPAEGSYYSCCTHKKCDSSTDDFASFQEEQFSNNERAPADISVTRSEYPAERLMKTPSSELTERPESQSKARQERKRMHNRTAQQQWRDRKKTRTKRLEAEIAAKRTQVKGLQAQQQQLEARNALMEPVSPDASDDEAQHIYTLGNVDLTDLMRNSTQQTLTITVLPGPPQVRTRQEVSSMSFAEFAMLTAAYARKLLDCFVEVTKCGSPPCSPAPVAGTWADSNSPAQASQAAANSPALDQLRKWTRECSSLRAFLAIANPRKFLTYITHRLDGVPGLRMSELGTEWDHEMLAAMQFTEEQQQDLMLLRRLFFGKLGVIAREREECLKRMPCGDAAAPLEVNCKIPEVVTIAQELRDLTAIEKQTRLQFTSAYRRGIYTLTQQAMSMVKAFPYVDRPQIFDLLAAERGEASAGELMEPAGLDNFEHSAKWHMIVKYLGTVDEANVDAYVPIMNSS